MATLMAGLTAPRDVAKDSATSVLAVPEFTSASCSQAAQLCYTGWNVRIETLVQTADARQVRDER